MKTIIIGDIHGCYKEFISLLEKAQITPGRDRIISVGDIIDRGTESLSVVRFFRDTSNTLVIRGNHEAKFLKQDFSDEADPSGKITLTMYKKEEVDEILSFIDNGGKGFPFYHIIENTALIVHAGLEPGKSLEEQEEKVIIGTGSQGRKYFNAEPYWYDFIDYPLPVIFGHTATDEVIRGQKGNVYGIDTGCAEGGKLTGLLMPEFKAVSVESERDYYEDLKRKYLPVIWKEELMSMSHRRIERLDIEYFDNELKIKIKEIAEEKKKVLELLNNLNSRLQEKYNYKNLEGHEKANLFKKLREIKADGADIIRKTISHKADMKFIEKYYPAGKDIFNAYKQIEEAGNMFGD